MFAPADEKWYTSAQEDALNQRKGPVCLYMPSASQNQDYIYRWIMKKHDLLNNTILF